MTQGPKCSKMKYLSNTDLVQPTPPAILWSLETFGPKPQSQFWKIPAACETEVNFCKWGKYGVGRLGQIKAICSFCATSESLLRPATSLWLEYMMSGKKLLPHIKFSNFMYGSNFLPKGTLFYALNKTGAAV